MNVVWNWLTQRVDRRADQRPQSRTEALIVGVIILALTGATLVLWLLIALREGGAVIWSGWALLAAVYVLQVLLQIHRYRDQVRRGSAAASDSLASRLD